MRVTSKSEAPVPLEDQLCYSIYSASLAIQRVYKPLLDELGLTYPQYLVLNVLWRNDQQRVGVIADQLGLESSTLTPLLKRLEAAGLVHRARNPENERQVLVELTEKGSALMKELRARSRDHEKRLAAVIGEDGRQQLLKLLHGVIEAVGPGSENEED